MHDMYGIIQPVLATTCSVVILAILVSFDWRKSSVGS